MKFVSLCDASNKPMAVPLRSVVRIDSPWCFEKNGKQMTPWRYPLLYRIGRKIHRGMTDAASLIAAGIPLPSPVSGYKN